MAGNSVGKDTPSQTQGENSVKSATNNLRLFVEEAELWITLEPPFTREIGYCWVGRLSAFPEAAQLAAIADDESEPSRSIAWIYEDGIPLGPAHASHAVIREAGHGAFSHWKDS